MNLIGEEVIHSTFGKGNVTDYDDSYINIKFKTGEKKFVFPDAFKNFIKFTDKKAIDLVDKKLQKQESKRIKEEKIIKQEKALEQQRLQMIEQKRNRRNKTIHPKIQSVFWCNEEDEKTCFEKWEIFTGTIKSGKKKGEPRSLARMNQNSACLLTKRTSDMKEEDRKILGLFMVNESFDGREATDGYIEAHPIYRIQLSDEESEKMLFWNYYSDEKFPNRMTWNSGRQRYFDNIWLAQILRDIIALRENTEGKKEAEDFFNYFCNINIINQDDLEEASGALIKA